MQINFQHFVSPLDSNNLLQSQTFFFFFFFFKWSNFTGKRISLKKTTLSSTIFIVPFCYFIKSIFIPLQYYDYERLIKILLYIVSCHEGGDELNFVLLAGICLLNTVACQVDGKQKLILGDMGAMEKMLELIRFRLNMSKFAKNIQKIEI